MVVIAFQVSYDGNGKPNEGDTMDKVEYVIYETAMDANGKTFHLLGEINRVSSYDEARKICIRHNKTPGVACAWAYGGVVTEV